MLAPEFEFNETVNDKSIVLIPVCRQVALGIAAAGISGSEAKIAHFLVIPPGRRRGIGTEMMTRIENWARAKRLEILSMDVDTNPRFSDKYESLRNYLRGKGFSEEESGRWRKHLK